MIEEEKRVPFVRWVLISVIAAAGIAGIGVFHKCAVQPQEKVWGAEGPVNWADPMPLTIGTSANEFKRPLGMMVERLNEQVGCKLLLVVDNDPSVSVIRGTIEVAAESQDWAAGTSIRVDRESRLATRGQIVVFHPLMVGTDLWVLWHEAGHVFGLAHDRAFVMRAITEEVIGGPLLVPRFSDKDAAALRARYCGGSQ